MLNQASKLLPKKKEIAVADLEKLATEGALTGWHECLAQNVYFGAPGVGSTDLKRILRSPKKYMFLKANPEQPTDAMQFGSVFHAMLLEEDTFEHFYAVKPLGTDRRTKVGKEAYEAFEKANAGKTVIHHETFEQAYAMVKRIKEHPRVAKMLKAGKPEFTVFNQGADGVVQKARADLYIPEGGIITDFKTTEDASPEAFARTIFNYGYDVQAGAYTHVFKESGMTAGMFLFVVIEKKPPYEMGLYYLQPSVIDVGIAKMKKAKSVYANCKATDIWPGLGENFQEISMPKWAFDQSEALVNGK